jgi:Rod binding domain-containing protein
MTPDAVTGAASAPAVASAPPAKGSEARQAGEGFERMLLGQLTKQLVDSAMPEGEAASAATGAYKQMLPDALTEALMSGGGIGLAQQLAAATKAATS